jgi:hypothetical protein
MGGYGAIMNSLRSNMRTFGTTCGFSGGLYIWNLPDFQNSIAQLVVQEAQAVQCNFTKPPYRYYANAQNWNTLAASSLALVFNSNFRELPEANSPYWSPNPGADICTGYTQLPGFEFWLDENGNLDQDLFSAMTVRDSPYSFVQRNNQTLLKSLSNNIYVSFWMAKKLTKSYLLVCKILPFCHRKILYLATC